MNRRLRGAIGNALAWGAAWYVVSLTIFTVLRITGVIQSTAPWIEVARGCMKFAVMGTIAGGAFSTFIGLRYRGRSLSQNSAGGASASAARSWSRIVRCPDSSR